MAGISYMGSKRKLADKIVFFIKNRHPDTLNFHDLFGGGGSISMEALKYKDWNVHYNELDKGVYELMKYLKEHDSLGDEFYKWYTREEFETERNNPNPTYLTGFLMTCWSFGNNGDKGYLYGKDIEEGKRLLHKMVVFKDEDAAKKLNFKNYEELFNIDSIEKRKNAACKYFKNIGKSNDMYNLRRAEVLGRLQNLQNLQISNKSYNEVIIDENSVIYCDPPYSGTSSYKHSFDSDSFYQWFASLQYPAYLSEYDAPFECVQQYSHKSLICATDNTKNVVESLFWNGKGNPEKTTLF